MTTVSLHDVPFTTFIGIYPEEKTVPNHIICNMDVMYDKPPGQGIGATVDYTILYAILKRNVDAGAGLLEELAAEVAGNVKERFPFITGLSISIRKSHPPMEGFTGSVSVTLQKTYP